ncbi:hypothetical protein [Streptosporangium sp. NPDC051022]|uniref:hypothetical protein n=1 Tax=Streptosporangium sp. NPDC051022 TaxID=3155752 RepID=UPI00341D7526
MTGPKQKPGQRLAARLITVAALYLLAAWALIQLLRVLHGWLPAIPPMGYGTALLVVVLLDVTLAPFRTPQKDGAS